MQELVKTAEAALIAKEVLEEIAAVLLRKGCILVHKPDCMVLALSRGEKPAQAIGQVVEIAGRVVWRRIEQ